MHTYKLHAKLFIYYHHHHHHHHIIWMSFILFDGKYSGSFFSFFGSVGEKESSGYYDPSGYSDKEKASGKFSLSFHFPSIFFKKRFKLKALYFAKEKEEENEQQWKLSSIRMEWYTHTFNVFRYECKCMYYHTRTVRMGKPLLGFWSGIKLSEQSWDEWWMKKYAKWKEEKKKKSKEMVLVCYIIASHLLGRKKDR